MFSSDRSPRKSELVRPQWLSAYQTVSGLSVFLVFMMAILAGRGWFINLRLIATHGTLSNVVWLAIVSQVVLAFVVGFPPALRPQLLTIDIGLFVLITTQAFLGYRATSDSPSAEAAAWHIPMGVLIFGLLAYQFSAAMRLRR